MKKRYGQKNRDKSGESDFEKQLSDFCCFLVI